MEEEEEEKEEEEEEEKEERGEQCGRQSESREEGWRVACPISTFLCGCSM